jgi:hypothetical protein
MSYQLADDVSVCESDGHFVFLNLATEQYIAVSPRESESIRSLFSSTSGLTSVQVPSVLVDAGLMEKSRAPRLEIRPLHLAEPVSSISLSSEKHADISAVDVWNFLVAWVRAGAMLRFLRMKAIAKILQARKKSSLQARLRERNDAEELASIYLRVRPRFFSSVDVCLRDSLTLMEFLARYKCYPTWVIGVRVQPFAAHSWVQLGALVLNDTPAHVKSFSPLLAV